jgi:hypothetical protein
LRRHGYFNIPGISYNTEVEKADELLAPYSDNAREIALKTCALVKKLIPDSIEQVDMASNIIAYGYNRTYKGLICAVAPQKSYVNLMFSRGVDLSDPAHLLEGTGKRARHVKLSTPAELDAVALKQLILESVRLHGRFNQRFLSPVL